VNTKTIKIIVMSFVLLLLIFSFIKCSSPVSGSGQTDETTSGSIDFSTMPSNSEFLNEESE